MAEAEHGDAQAWIRAFHTEMKGKPPNELFDYFRGPSRKEDLTVQIVNLAHELIKRAFPDNVLPEDPYVSRDFTNIFSAQCALYLYYRVLHHMLQSMFPLPAAEPISSRFKKQTRAQPDPQSRVLLIQVDLHSSLLQCAVEVVCFVVFKDPCHHFPWGSQRLQRADCMLGLWDVIRYFDQCFSPSSAFPLPPCVRVHLRTMKTLIEERLAFQQGSILYEVMALGGGSQYPEGDMSLLNLFMEHYARLALHRTHAATEQLLMGSTEQPISTLRLVVLHACKVMDYLLCHEVQLCYDRHMSVLVACSIYIMAKAHRLSVSFKKITQLLARTHMDHSDDLFKRVSLTSSLEVAGSMEDDRTMTYGDIREFYNKFFLPKLEGFVRELMRAADVPQPQPAASLAPSQPSSTTTPSHQNTNKPHVRFTTPGADRDAQVSKENMLAGGDVAKVLDMMKGAKEGGQLTVKAASDDCQAATVRTPFKTISQNAKVAAPNAVTGLR